MSEPMPDAQDPVKSPGDYRRHTVAWRPEEWQRIQDAALRLAEEAHVDISEVDLIRGAVLRRADEILAAAA